PSRQHPQAVISGEVVRVPVDGEIKPRFRLRGVVLVPEVKQRQPHDRLLESGIEFQARQVAAFGIIPAVRLREILSLQEWNQVKMRLFVRDGLQERIALLASSGRIQKAGALDRLVFLQPVLRVWERPGGGGLDGGRISNVTQRS